MIKKGILAVFTVISIGVVAQVVNEEKKYSVQLTMEQWKTLLENLERIKDYNKTSSAPAKDVTFINDSIISPIQNVFSYQINQQVVAESESTNKKKN